MLLRILILFDMIGVSSLLGEGLKMHLHPFAWSSDMSLLYVRKTSGEKSARNACQMQKTKIQDFYTNFSTKHQFMFQKKNPCLNNCLPEIQEIVSIFVKK